MPAEWTDVVVEDPFVVVAAGRSPFRTVDLLELAGLIFELSRAAGLDRGLDLRTSSGLRRECPGDFVVSCARFLSARPGCGQGCGKNVEIPGH
ncbi:MAG: DUF5372 family protein [Pseudonocardiaceae bacterium]